MIDFTAWTNATASLSWGAQHAIHDALSLAAEGKVTIVYGADYMDGQPCLINSVGQMLEVGGGNGVPCAHFGNLVQEFDWLNDRLEVEGVNTDRRVMSPNAAMVLVHHFGELKPEPSMEIPVLDPHEANFDEIIPEASDADLAQSWLKAIAQDNAPVDEPMPAPSAPTDDEIQALIDVYPNWR